MDYGRELTFGRADGGARVSGQVSSRPLRVSAFADGRHGRADYHAITGAEGRARRPAGFSADAEAGHCAYTTLSRRASRRAPSLAVKMPILDATCQRRR